MKKIMIMFLLILSNYLFSSEIEGDIYNLERRGSSYSGTFNVKLNNRNKNIEIKLIPSKDINIVRVNGNKEDNNIYNSKDGSLKIDFIYTGKIEKAEERIFLGKIYYNDGVQKAEDIVGRIAVDFRKKGKIDMNIRGDMDFGTVPVKVSKSGIKSKRNPEIIINLDIDKKDVGNTKLYIEYPENIEMINGQVVIKIDSRSKSDFINIIEKTGKTLKVLGYRPKSEKTIQKIELVGTLYSKVQNLEPGIYKESVRVKAYYEYLDYSIENKHENKVVVVRR